MLAVRMIIFAGIAGIAFWGLFQLLDNLREPALLRTTKAVAVKGCASLDEHEDAPRLCPQYLCQKALIDRKLVPLEARFVISTDDSREGRRVINGDVATGQAFECVVEGLMVKDARLVP